MKRWVSLFAAVACAAGAWIGRTPAARAAEQNSYLVTSGVSPTPAVAGQPFFSANLTINQESGGFPTLAGDELGESPTTVVDRIRVHIVSSNGNAADWDHSYYPDCSAPSPTPLPPFRLSSLINANHPFDAYTVRVELYADCHTNGQSSPLWIVLKDQLANLETSPSVAAVYPQQGRADVGITSFKTRLTEFGTGHPIVGRRIDIYGDSPSRLVCSATTGADGRASCGGPVAVLLSTTAWRPNNFDILDVGPTGYFAVFNGDAFYMQQWAYAPSVNMYGVASF